MVNQNLQKKSDYLRNLSKKNDSYSNLKVWADMTNRERLLLTPLSFRDSQGSFICIAIRDPKTEEIVKMVVTSHDLAEKAGIPLEDAQRIFQAARDAVEARLAE